MIYKKLDKSEKLQVTLRAAMLDYNWKGIAKKLWETLSQIASDCNWLQVTMRQFGSENIKWKTIKELELFVE